MAQFNNPYLPYLNTLQGQLAAQQEAELNPAPMFTPEEVARRQAAQQRMLMAGQLGMLSNDPSITGIAKPLLQRSMEAAKPRYGDHGLFDETSGKFSFFPGYHEARRTDSTSKQLDRMTGLAAQADTNWQRDRARADDQSMLRMALAAMRQGQGGAAGTYNYAGVDPDSGSPIMLHNRTGQMFVNGPNGLAPYRGSIGPKPNQPSDSARTAMSGLNTQIEQLDNSLALADQAKAEGKGKFSTGAHIGVIAESGPLAQALTAKYQPEVVRKMMRETGFVVAGIRRGLFGATLTPMEKADANKYIVTNYDSLESAMEKAESLRNLLHKDRTNMQSAHTRPGIPPAVGMPGAPTGAPIPNTAAPAPRLPPGWTVEVVPGGQ